MFFMQFFRAERTSVSRKNTFVGFLLIFSVFIGRLCIHMQLFLHPFSLPGEHIPPIKGLT